MLVNRLHSVVGQYTLLIAAQEGLLPAFYKHFSGHERTQMSDRQGRCSSGRHVRSNCRFPKPWGLRSGLGEPGSNPGGATHSGTHSTRPPERSSGGRLFPPPSPVTTTQNMQPLDHIPWYKVYLVLSLKESSKNGADHWSGRGRG